MVYHHPTLLLRIGQPKNPSNNTDDYIGLSPRVYTHSYKFSFFMVFAIFNNWFYFCVVPVQVTWSWWRRYPLIMDSRIITLITQVSCQILQPGVHFCTKSLLRWFLLVNMYCVSTIILGHDVLWIWFNYAEISAFLV